MKRLIPILFLVLPLAAFAQAQMGPNARETELLKGFGLNDSQISQVFDIQNKTRVTIRQNVVQLRLLRAQMEKALLPANPNMQEVNGYITQIAQTHADLMKAFVGARVQLRQIVGDDNFPAYARFIMHRFGFRHAGHPDFGMMGGDGPMMRGNDPPTGLTNRDGEQTD